MMISWLRVNVVASLLLVLLCGYAKCSEDLHPESATTFAEFASLLERKLIFPNVDIPVVVAVALPHYPWEDLQHQLSVLQPANVTAVFLRCPNRLPPAAVSFSWAPQSAAGRKLKSTSLSNVPVSGHRNLLLDGMHIPQKTQPGGLPVLPSRQLKKSWWWPLSPRSQLAQKQLLEDPTSPPASLLSAADTSTNLTQLCVQGHSQYMEAIAVLLRGSQKSNLLIYGSRAAPGFMSGLALFAAQMHDHIDRVALAVEKDGSINHATVVNTATGGREEYVRSTLTSVFQQIYDRKVWSDAGLGSGPGSSLEYTEVLREQLVNLLVQNGIKTMVDAPCGGMLWMPLVLRQVQAQVPDFKYYGLDVSCGVIQQVKERLSNDSNWQFSCSDVSEANFPIPTPDLVFSRDAMQHLPLATIYKFLTNVKRQQAKYLLIGSYLNTTANVNIAAGQYFSLNLMAPPFNVRPPPLMVLKEKPTEPTAEPQKYMVLLDVEKMEWDQPAV